MDLAPKLMPEHDQTAKVVMSVRSATSEFFNSIHPIEPIATGTANGRYRGTNPPLPLIQASGRAPTAPHRSSTEPYPLIHPGNPIILCFSRERAALSPRAGELGVLTSR